ncbi:MAG: transketolase [Actinobacteria bacterium]|nr:transketolase [Actinomycetota bacterium]
MNEASSKSDDQLARICAQTRANILRMCHKEGMSHVGSAFSMVEILVALYFRVMRIDPADPKSPERDIFILSKGHSCAGLYNVLAQAGFFPQGRLGEYCKFKKGMGGHPDLHMLPGVEVCSGSLGHGLPLAIGMAIAAKRDGRDKRIFVLMGDGELDEGTVWEAAMAAAHYKLDNLIAIVDRNGLQADSRTEVAMSLEPLDAKWLSFGWNVETVDGHDLGRLVEVLRKMRQTPCPDKPGLVIAKTVKGKGVSFMEDQQAWHFNKPTAEDLSKGLEELGCQ